MSEEKVKELTKDIQRRIKSTNRWLSANKSIGNPEGEAFRQIEIYELALAALTQPASPALKLPDAKPVDLADENWDDVSLAENIGFNRCLLEVKRLNAPHTAPTEPICASGRTMPPHEFSLMVNELRDVDNTQSRRAKIIGILHAFNIRPRKPE